MNSSIQLNLAVTEDHPFYEVYIGQVERHNNSVNNVPFLQIQVLICLYHVTVKQTISNNIC